MGRLSARAGAAAWLLLGAAGAAAAPSLIRNGAFTEGSGTQPSEWRTAAWRSDIARFGWEGGEDTGNVSIVNEQPNDARWCQSISVEPGGLYRISARVKTQGVGEQAAGAFISVEPRVADSRLVTGTGDWQPIELVVRAEAPTTTWDVCLRLGSYGSLNTGTAWFSDVATTMVGRDLTAAADPARPSAVAGLWRAARDAGWVTLALPVVAGLLLAFGLGVLDRRKAG